MFCISESNRPAVFQPLTRFLLFCFLVVVALLFSVSAGQALAEETSIDCEIPRVEIISMDKTAVPDLPYKGITVRAKLIYQDSENTFTSPITLKLQGNSTLSYEKKNYTIKFFEDEACTEKKKISFSESWGAHSKYCLKSNYQDSTHARNIVASRLAAEINRAYGIFPDAPNYGMTDGFPVELVIDGDYRGLYTWNIPKDNWMFHMEKNDADQLLMQAYNQLSESILFRKEALGEDLADWNLEEGLRETPEDISGAYEKLNRLIRFVMDSSDEEFRNSIDEYLSLDACLNYYCFAAYTNTTDNMAKNMLLVTLDGKVWYPCLYDLDTSFGLYFNGMGIYSTTNRVEQFSGGDSLLWKRLVDVFPQELYDRYRELRKSYLNEEHIMSLFEEFANQIPDEIRARDLERWPDAPGREFGLDSIRSHIREREGFIDGTFSQLPHAKPDYKDPRILFELETPYFGSPNRFLDTGINLFENGRNFTIFLKYRNYSGNTGQTLLSDNNTSKQGLMVLSSGKTTDDYTMFYAGNQTYEALYAQDTDGYSYVIITREGDHYTFIGKSINDQRDFISPMNSEVTTNLILGGNCCYDSDGRLIVNDQFFGVIEACLVYNGSLIIGEMEEILYGLRENE